MTLDEITEVYRLATIFHCLGNAWKISADSER